MVYANVKIKTIVIIYLTQPSTQALASFSHIHHNSVVYL
jgi:hypothetical protein